MPKIFYSWQSDLPNSCNRGFIEKALIDAIDQLNLDLNLDSALRDGQFEIDSDTQGVPGTPPIFDTIVEKIEAAHLFVADISTIARSAAGKPCPNPNVLIEYGIAVQAIGNRRILLVVNEAFKDDRDILPFDLQHKRKPIVYNVPENCSLDEKKRQKENLIKSLKTALGSANNYGLLNAKTEHSPEIDKRSSFLANDQTIATIKSIRGDDLRILWEDEPHLFLHLVPLKAEAELSPLDALELSTKFNLSPVSYEHVSKRIRNIEGCCTYAYNGVDSDDSYTRSLTQFFLNHELWGISSHNMIESLNYQKIIQIDYVKNTLVAALGNYLAFYEQFDYALSPIKLICGLGKVQNFAIDSGGTKPIGNCIEPHVVYEGNINELTSDRTTLQAMIRPCIEKIWESCGLRMK